MTRQKKQKKASLFDMATAFPAETSVLYHTLALSVSFFDFNCANTCTLRSARGPFSLVLSPCRGHCIHGNAKEPYFAHDTANLYQLCKALQFWRGWHALFAGC